MIDRDVVAAKLAELSDRVARVEAHRAADGDALAADRDALDLVAFNLMLAVQTCADLAAHFIADEGWAPARTTAEAFARLAAEGVVTRDTADALARAAGVRNVVAHGYAQVDPTLVHQASHQGVSDLRRFAADVGAWVGRQAT